MSPNVYVGLAVTSHNNTALNASTFNNVSVTTDSDFWTDLVGVTVNSSNGLTKTSTTTGWNAGAYSVQALSGDGYVEFSTDENSTGKTCGLSADFTGQNYIGIDYAITLGGGNQARIYENGVQKGTFTGNYLPGQRYRVSIEGTTVKYYKDGVAHSYTGTVSPTHSLRVDTSLSTPGATITNVVFFSKLTWTNLVGVAVNSSNDLTKTSTTTGWNAGATSVQTLSGNGYVEFSTDNTTTGKACGLNSNHVGQNYTEIDYVITLGASGYIRIYEEGNPIPKPGTTTDYLIGRYAAGDVFRVEIDSGMVRYCLNGEVLIEHAINAASQYVVDTSFNTTGAKITDAVISGAWSN
jgi:hypothetical protein